MRKLIYILSLFLVIGLTFTSCNETQKKDLKNVQENIEKNATKAAKTVEEGAKKAGEEIKKGAKKVSEAAKEGASDVSDAVKKGANEVSNTVKEGAEKVKKEFASAEYQCPMKCEGDKVYHEEGKCPKCGMKLKKIN